MTKLLSGISVFVILGVFIIWNFGGANSNPRDRLEGTIKNLEATRKVSPQEKTVLKMHLAIQDYMATVGNGKPPVSLSDLVPTYFDSVPFDPRTNAPMVYVAKDGAYKLGEKSLVATELANTTGSQSNMESGSRADLTQSLAIKSFMDGSKTGFINPNEMKSDNFVFDPSGLRDPFQRFNLLPIVHRDGSALTALEKYSIGELRLTIVLEDKAGELVAMVEDSEGKGYTVRAGTKIGNKGGEVVKVEKDEIKILEKTTTYTGEEKTNVIQMKISKSRK